MTLTVRSATVSGATTKGSALTHAELDENFNHLSQASNHTFTPSGTGAVSQTVQNRMRKFVFVTDFIPTALHDGIWAGTDTTDLTAYIQAAIDYLELQGGGGLYFPFGRYLAAGVDVADNKKVILFGTGAGSIIKKNANGAIVTLGKQCQMEKLYLDGDGATYTGVGVTISSGTNENTSWRRIHDCDIFDTASYGVEFSASAAGYGSVVSESRIVPRTVTVAAIKLPAPGSAESNGNRTITNCYSGSNSLCEVGEAAATVIEGCQGGIPTMQANSSKLTLVGNRLVSWTAAATWTITGSNHQIDANSISLTAGTDSITLAAGLAGSFVNLTGTTTTIVDNSDGSNHVWYNQQTYTPTWTGGTPSIGDGTLNGSWQRMGNKVKGNIQFAFGSTSNAGSGAWQFSLPLSSSARKSASGGVYIEDASPTAVYNGSPYISAAGTTLFTLTSASTSAYTGSATPITWANGDTMVIDFEYQITQ
jgi:hypothetical protein